LNDTWGGHQHALWMNPLHNLTGLICNPNFFIDQEGLSGRKILEIV
jgi:hypothetical protein